MAGSRIDMNLSWLLIFSLMTAVRALAVNNEGKANVLEELDAVASPGQIDRLDSSETFDDFDMKDPVEELVAQFAPILHLHPEERWRPGDVESFIRQVDLWDEENERFVPFSDSLPIGPATEEFYLVAGVPQGIGTAGVRHEAFLAGTPAPETPPVYVTVTRCGGRLDTNSLTSATDPELPSFHATYWVFYPFNQGKKAAGTWRGNHVGDWEHVSIRVQEGRLTDIYVSSHDFGAYYQHSAQTDTFDFVRQNSRSSLPVWPKYPPHITMEGTHPVLYVSLGSHGIWPTPGEHVYLGMWKATLSDVTAPGPAWHTWHRLEHLWRTQPAWLQYRGYWGNPRDCLNLFAASCHISDGPPGIAGRAAAFQCVAPPAQSWWQSVKSLLRWRRAAGRSRRLRRLGHSRQSQAEARSH